MAFSTTEITSSSIVSDNPVHQRLFFAYHEAAKLVGGNLLEIGCGVGRGLDVLAQHPCSIQVLIKYRFTANVTENLSQSKFYRRTYSTAAWVSR
jgi:hypothetical protein